MATFVYKALTPAGELLEGRMEAEAADEVIARIQDAGNIPIEALSADEAAGQVSLARLFRRRGASTQELLQFTQQLATMLGAGLPLDRALGILADIADNERLQRLILRLRDKVRGGSPLSEALDDEHGTFSRLYVNMVRAGEAGGALEETLARLAEYQLRSKNLRDSIVSALIYPAILVLLAIASLVILLVFVVPRFTPIFEQLGGELPLLTRMVLGIGALIQHYGWLLFGLALGLALLIQRQLSHPESRYAWDRRLLETWLLGDLITKVETARITRTIGTLLKNGVPLLGALSISRNISGNRVLAEALENAAGEVKTGGGLAQTLAASKRFPRLALQMINVGEETGQLEAMLLKVADAYDREVAIAIERALALLVPAMTLLMTGMIAIIVMSILLPILAVTELVQ